MKLPVFTLAALFAGSAVSTAFAQTAPKLPGSKSNIILTLTATSEVGGFLIKDSALAGLEEKGVTFDEGGIANPLGYDSEGTGANYYRMRQTSKSKNFGTTADPEFHATLSVYEEAKNLLSEKFTNKEFIDALINRGYAGDTTSGVGFKLVAIFAADFQDGGDELPVLFFIENEKTHTIHYVGRQASYDAIVAEDAMAIDFHEGAEKASFKSSTVFATKKVGADVIVDDTGVTTDSGSYTGTNVAYVDFFPGHYVYNSETDSNDYVRTGTSLYFGGAMSYSGKLDANSSYSLTVSANLPVAASFGSFEDDEYDANDAMSDERRGRYVQGSFILNGTKKIDDITPYLDALPASLAELKQTILNNYAK